MPGLLKPRVKLPVLLLQQYVFALCFPDPLLDCQRYLFVTEVALLQFAIQPMNPELRVFTVLRRRRQNQLACAVVQVTLQFRCCPIRNVVVDRTQSFFVGSELLRDNELL